MMKKMISKTILIILFAGQISLIFAGAKLTFFNAKSEGGDIVLEWQTAQETNLKEFIVQRRTLNSKYIDLAKVNPKGDNSLYTYRDESAYKTTDAFFIYRLKIVDTDGSNPHYSAEVSISHNISSVKRTWGSIKALFR
jgi:hypothetical protein